MVLVSAAIGTSPGVLDQCGGRHRGGL